MDFHDNQSEFFHMSQMQSGQQSGGWKFGYIGYIQSYDPTTNEVIVLNTENANPVTGTNILTGLPTPMASPPMQLGTNLAGLNLNINPINAAITRWGIQICPIGGSSAANPTGGEQVLVMHLNQNIGFGVCAAFLFTTVAQTPGGAPIPVSGAILKAGEWLFIHPSGTTMHFTNKGNINIYVTLPEGGTGDLNVGVDGGISINTNTVAGTVPPVPNKGDIDIVAAANINETAVTQINITAPTVNIGTNSTLYKLLTSAFLTAFNSHIHTTPSGNSGPPITTISPIAPYLTQATLAN